MKNLKYFMREHKEEIITVPGLESFKDENGNVIDFKIKRLTAEEMDRITEGYKKRTVATDKRGNPIVSNGEIVWKTEVDSKRATRHLIAEAFVEPELKNKELMDYYKCIDVSEIVRKVFPYADDYLQVVKKFNDVNGIGEDFKDKDEKEVEDAKN